MRVVSYSLHELGYTAIDLGKRGENKVREIEFDLRDWIAEYPGASVALYISQPNTTVYLATTKMVDGALRWPIIDTYTAIPGFGDAEIVLSGADGERLKSVTASIFVSDSLSDGAPGEAPDYMKPYVDQVAENAAKVEKAVEEIKGIVVQSGNMPTGGTAGDALVKQSNAYGDAAWKALTAADVGALPSDGTAVNATQLNGKGADYYYNKDNLVFDDAPVEGSTNPITSGAVKTALDGLIAAKDFAFVVSFEGGTIGTRGAQLTVDADLEGYKKVSATVAYIQDSQACHPLPFFVSNDPSKLFLNVYRAAAYAITEQKIWVTVLYVKNA